MKTAIRPTLSVRLRAKNQVTIPDEIVQVMGLSVGDRFFAQWEEPGQVVLRKIPKTYAGALAGLWSSLEEIDAGVRELRDSWRDE